MNKPSSTITAATLAGIAMSLIWGSVNEFTDITVSAGYISLSVTFVSGAVGYLRKETTYNMTKKD